VVVTDLFSPPETQCPVCGQERFSWREIPWRSRLSLLATRLVSKVARQLVGVQLRCRACRALFDHLHVLPRTVVGYHACRQDFARKLITGKVRPANWLHSRNVYDWLGEGVYFWEHAPGRAWQWADERFGSDGAVVAAEVRLGRCLDLADTIFTHLLGRSYEYIVNMYHNLGRDLPKNEGKNFKLRKLDRLVIDTLTQLTDPTSSVPYQTVRCPFEKGEQAYEGGMIKTQSHVQIAVRDRNCILSPVYPVARQRR
jgi:hypothetical protein